MKALYAALPASLFLLLTSAATRLDGEGEKGSWPQWRGPENTGVSTETDWAVEGKPESLWRTEVGLGYSSVAVQNGRVYTMGFIEEFGEDVVWCFDALSGEELWSHAYPAKIWNQAHRGGTVNTPTADGDVVYTLNREGNLFCLDAESGEERWHVNITETLDVTPPTWGFSASPLILGDQMIINAGKVLALDKQTGKLQWASKDYGHAYGQPTAFDLNGKPVVAVFNGGGLGVLQRETGEELYAHSFGEGQGRGVNASSPVLVEGATLFVSSSPSGGGTLLALGDEGVEILWESKVMTTGLSEAILLDGHLYGFDGEVLKCIDPLGEEKWSQRGIGAGAVMGAPGRLIVMGGDGALVVAEATPAGYSELSRTELFDGGRFWTKPILVDGIIYCRSSDGGLVARDHRGSE